jgi:hypothetical protein
MSDANVATAEGETRQAMIRVWMAISAIWIAFWLALAALIVATGEMADPLTNQFRLFALIVMTPPLVLFAIGGLVRWTVETRFRKRNDSRSTVRSSH